MSSTAPGFPETPEIAKAQAKRLRTALHPDHQIGHSRSLELVARLHGEPSWGRMSSLYSSPGQADMPAAGSVAPNGGIPRVQPAHPPAGHLNQKALRALRSGLRSARPTKLSPKALAKAQELVRDEILRIQCIESWLDELDVNLGNMAFEIGLDDLVKILRIEPIDRFARPHGHDGLFLGERGVRQAGFAAALIRLDRFGFDVHPEVFIDPLLDGIASARYLDKSELDCFLFKRERKGFVVRESWFDAVTAIDHVEVEEFTTSNGTKVAVEHARGDPDMVRSITMARG